MTESKHKAGFVNIVGNPNVGKSTLMNLLVGERISIATFKAQTTRHRIMGILNTPEMQICFSDTPGVLKPNYKLQEQMLQFSESALQDADVLLYVTDMVETPDKNMEFLQKVQHLQVPVLVLINKIDLTDSVADGQKVNGKALSGKKARPSDVNAVLAQKVEAWRAVLPNAEVYPISALHHFGVDQVLLRIKELLPESPAYFDKDTWTDKPARFFVTEIIREKILLYYDKEIPYSVEPVVERFKETEDLIRIEAVIYVERESQKGIIIGHQGVALKRVSTEARKELERFFGKRIYLQCFVKVDKDWRNSDKAMKQFGYDLE
ncbi:MAG: GTPase Era [Bacteroidales bacterium]|nr:GTPase Era [Bacteroidales bacterium]